MAIIVGVDGSPASRRALEWATEEARLRGERVVALLAFGIPPVYEPYGSVPGAGDSPLFETLRRAATDDLAGVLGDVGVPEGVRVDSEVVEHANPALALTERAGPDDLLVVGSRGRGGFKGLLLGSVSQQCVTHAVCPTVVIPRSMADEEEAVDASG